MTRVPAARLSSRKTPGRSSGATLTAWLIGLTVLLAVSIGAGVAIGSADLSIQTVWMAIGGRLRIGPGVDVLTDHIVVEMRLPRVLAAAATGAGLALCGAVLQSLTGNLLADPYILGMAGGASLGAVAVLTTGIGTAGLLSLSAVSTAAFVGALVSLLAVFVIAVTHGGALLPSRLVLAGIAVGQLCAALSSALIYFSDSHAADRVLRWTLGSVAGVRWTTLWLLLITVGIVAILLFTNARALDSFAFGERSAAGLGTSVTTTRWLLYSLVSVCTAVIVAQAGIVGFVGLVVPHVARMLVGPLHLRLLPVVALLGALLLIWADLFARTLIDDREIPLGLITAVLGVPVFVWLLRRPKAAL